MSKFFRKSLSSIVMLLVLVQNSFALNTVELSVEYIANPAIGRALSLADIYVGVVDLDPKNVANQKQISVLQENGTTVQVSQPISTSAGGVPLYNGSPITILVDGSYSMRIDDSSGEQVYYVPSITTITDTVEYDHNEDGSHIVYDSIANLRASTLTPFEEQKVSVTGEYTSGDFVWDSVNTEADNTGTIVKITGVTVGRWLRLLDAANTLNVSWFGATGTDDESAILEACAIVADGGTVIIPFQTFEVPVSTSSPTDCNGAIIKGNNTVLTGDLGNYKTVSGIIKSNPVEWSATHPTIATDLFSKFIYHSNANLYTVIIPTSKGKNVQIGIVNNVTTTTDSLASTTSDITAFRVSTIKNNVAAPTGYTTASAQSGVWESTDLIEVPTYTGGTVYTYERTSTSGGYSEYTITVPKDGFFSTSFVRRVDTSADIDITLDAVAVGTGISTVKPIGGDDDIYTIKYATSPGEHVIRITNNTTDSLRVAGINFAELIDQRADVDLDTFGAYRDDTTYNDIIGVPSENDIAIFDADAALWGNGYHGGATSIASEFLLDGVDTAITIAEFKVCKDLEIKQNYDVDWSGSGGGDFHFESAYAFKLGGYYYRASVTGSATDNVFYPTLFGVGTDFDEIVLPKYFDLGAAIDGTYYQFKGNMIEYQDSSNNQRVRIEHTKYDQSASLEGPFVLVSSTSNYHKYYNAWIVRGQRDVTDLSVVNSITVE